MSLFLSFSLAFSALLIIARHSARRIVNTVVSGLRSRIPYTNTRARIRGRSAAAEYAFVYENIVTRNQIATCALILFSITSLPRGRSAAHNHIFVVTRKTAARARARTRTCTSDAIGPTRIRQNRYSEGSRRTYVRTYMYSASPECTPSPFPLTCTRSFVFLAVYIRFRIHSHSRNDRTYISENIGCRRKKKRE